MPIVLAPTNGRMGKTTYLPQPSVIGSAYGVPVSASPRPHVLARALRATVGSGSNRTGRRPRCLWCCPGCSGTLPWYERPDAPADLLAKRERGRAPGS
jgi:hypothetical protein